jgi:hypothetical protein
MKTLCLVTIALLAAACSDSSTEAFIGTWSWRPGQIETDTCDGATSITSVTGTFKLSAGVSVPLVSTNSYCTINFQVSGDTATAEAGQSCTIVSSGVSVTNDINTMTLTLDNPATTLTATATTTEIGTRGACAWAGTATATKVTN